ncbi:hypothetical protein BHE74_00028332 [Ensete ventricosum]|nr:hypothetical protein GW17_00037658 [Ensete ventricosum]RWW64434.1 hypothetical protein BHE74_00028332 [Ensete ventricosum]RZS26964.1 hypothetical protein BHM03_00060388 [Ensete ventricosum]
MRRYVARRNGWLPLPTTDRRNGGDYGVAASAHLGRARTICRHRPLPRCATRIAETGRAPLTSAPTVVDQWAAPPPLWPSVLYDGTRRTDAGRTAPWYRRLTTTGAARYRHASRSRSGADGLDLAVRRMDGPEDKVRINADLCNNHTAAINREAGDKRGSDGRIA